MDLGVTYIPWEKVKVDDLDGFAEGGMIDQETVNAGENTHAFHYLWCTSEGCNVNMFGEVEETMLTAWTQL